MKHSRVISFFLAISSGVMTGMPLSALADDTEIYIGSNALAITQGVRPNVLFILDTSGSMSSTVTGTGMDRLDNMKVALKQILDDANNINVGLMRFTNPGGPILFPVAGIDEIATTIETAGQSDINVRVVDGDDDVEERLSDSKMFMVSERLEMINTPTDEDTNTDVNEQVITGVDDAEEWVNGGGSWNNSGTLEMVDYSGNGTQPRINGIRFQTINIPQGAYILESTLEFKSGGDQSSSAGILIYGEDENDAATYDNSNGEISGRTKTGAVVEWSGMQAWTSSTWYTSPDISGIVQELVCRGVGAATPACPDGVRDATGNWAADNDMAFIFTETTPTQMGYRNVRSYDNGAANAPKLRIQYGTGTGGEQYIGLRFQDVRVPQGVTIEDATIEFIAAADSNNTADFKITGEYVGDAAPFHATTEKVSEKLGRDTAAEVDWNGASGLTAWTKNQVYQTPDIKTVVEEIVARTDWCGGNDMVFIIRKDANAGPRTAHSFEGSPTGAPLLRISYDKDPTHLTAGEGCTVANVQRQVNQSSDDAEQVVGDGNKPWSSSSTLEMGFESNNQINGIRFEDIQIPPGAEILSAEMVLNARSTNGGDTDLDIKGHDADNAPTFDKDSAGDISLRPTTVKVDWDNIEAWSSGSDYTTPDLKTIVQELVCRGVAANAVCAGDPGDWQSGNAMAFIFTGTGLRQVRTWDRNRATAPILRISFKGTMAEGTVTTAVTVRERLKGIIDQLNHAGWTPIVDTLYEASRYYRGEGLVYGNDRGTDGSTVERNTRVSHNASYTGGTVSRDPGCTDADLNAEDCRTEHINGSPTYISPITDACATNHIILLTDGEANNNHSASLIRSMASLSSCQTTLSDSSSVIGGESCGVDLAKYINTNDQLLSLAGDQTVTVHTIGFNFSTQFLKDLAHETGGLFKEATTAAELATEIKAIFTDILNRSTSFAAPSLSVNAFNQIFHRNEVFFSLFKPADTIQWIGNVKKYYLCEDSSTGCTVGEILDADMVPAVSDLDGRIMDSARSEWTPVGQMDGAKIEEHGAGGKIPVFASRKVLTYTGTSAPANVSLDMVAHQVQDNNDDGILDGIATGDADVDLQRTKELLGVGGRSITQINANDLDFDLSTVIDAADVTAEKAALAATLNTLIQWILGEDVDDEDANPATTERFAFADPLHSSPVAVIFGGTDANPVMKLFVGTNDGGLRLINAKNGTEEWIFYPQSTLAKQSGFRANPNGNHEYGIDGTPKSWVYDKDSDGLIEKTDGDFVRILVGMRRGGNFNYAIDVTPAAVPTDPQSVVDIKPTLMWRAEGGSAEFSRLGQTWSQPRHTRIAVGTTTAGEVQLKDVIVFAGGYDDAQDSGFASGGLGNAIYFADASDGTRYLSISADDPGSGEKAIVPDMTYPIPSGVAMLDTNGDDTTNRLYVGDTGGQLWRVDIEPDVSATAGIHTVVGKLATVSGANNAADERKFFYEPDIVQIRDYDYSSSGNERYDLVTIVTGNRANPLNTSVQDRAYAFRDQPDPMVDGAAATPSDHSDDNGLADNYTTIQGPLTGPPAAATTLWDATNINDPTGANLTALQGSDGWYLDFESSGEKGLAPPLIFAGVMFFTTYLPEGVATGAVCALAEGAGNFYGVNVLNAAAVYNWDNIGGNPGKGDRTIQLKRAGIPTGVLAVMLKEKPSLLVNYEEFDPNVEMPKERTYWFQDD